ncbi:MAG: YolD-like family protein [Lachnospiraceae bacterium]|nr:YolD-like family protein [Lachnospiraceae bacterium]
MRTDDYSDIIDHPHYQSKKRPHMSLHDRAAQFSPFSALTGYDSMVKEAGRITDRQIFPDEDALTELNEKLTELSGKIDDRPEICITCFIPDDKKDGGSYTEITGRLKKIDEYERYVILTDGKAIPINTIIDISERNCIY